MYVHRNLHRAELSHMPQGAQPLPGRRLQSHGYTSGASALQAQAAGTRPLPVPVRCSTVCWTTETGPAIAAALASHTWQSGSGEQAGSGGARMEKEARRGRASQLWPDLQYKQRGEGRGEKCCVRGSPEGLQRQHSATAGRRMRHTTYKQPALSGLFGPVVPGFSATTGGGRAQAGTERFAQCGGWLWRPDRPSDGGVRELSVEEDSGPEKHIFRCGGVDEESGAAMTVFIGQKYDKGEFHPFSLIAPMKLDADGCIWMHMDSLWLFLHRRSARTGCLLCPCRSTYFMVSAHEGRREPQAHTDLCICEHKYDNHIFLYVPDPANPSPANIKGPNRAQQCGWFIPVHIHRSGERPRERESVQDGECRPDQSRILQAARLSRQDHEGGGGQGRQVQGLSTCGLRKTAPGCIDQHQSVW
ncbi:hypothetical protein DFH06DRAFT_1132629 [Mycena polygramma]|nr:hypothetical protein DFH06DRAFT_1132629 [Mycena polygramma]